MQENYLSKSLLLFSLITVTLLILSFLPHQVAENLHLKPIDLLVDIKSTIAEPGKSPVKTDTSKITLSSKIKSPTKESGKPKPTRIEDYSENKKAFHHLFEALKDVGQNSVRIAFFGDSFIEGDIFCGSFRDTLQQIYGGRGVGFMPITSDVAQFRTTIRHNFKNWKTFSLVGAKSPSSPLGTSGYCFVPLEGNEVEYLPSKKRNSKPFNSIRLYYISHAANRLNFQINDSLKFSKELLASDTLQEEFIQLKNMQSVKLQFVSPDSLKVYGTSIEDSVGVYVDNFSLRGNSGMGLNQIDRQQNREFNHFRDYKLIILQYGLNVVTESDTSGYRWYADKMINVVNRLKEHFPGTCILIVSVSDRSSNQNGKFATIPSIPTMRDVQREIAFTCKVAFWDLYSSMGGENSMVKFTNATPPLGTKDYTHLTFLGGKKLGKQLAEAILHERTSYESPK